MMETQQILNNRLPWDGSHLGFDTKITIIQKWDSEGTTYYGILIPPGIHSTNGGIIYCMATPARDLFPCIVEDLKNVFGLPRRGIHRITINKQEYIIYYVPISEKGEVVWETPLNRLDSKHHLRIDPVFKKAVQRTIAFCDILALCSTGETQIRIRPGSNGVYIPISCNEKSTAISKCAEYDYSILTKTLFSKWFGENTSISDVVKEMVNYNEKKIIVPTVREIEANTSNLAILTTNIRNKIDTIVRRYDNSYIWYSNFIVERMSRHLLIDN